MKGKERTRVRKLNVSKDRSERKEGEREERGREKKL